MLEKHDQTAQLRMSKKLKAEAKKLAEKRGIPLSRLLREALINELRREKRK